MVKEKISSKSVSTKSKCFKLDFVLEMQWKEQKSVSGILLCVQSKAGKIAVFGIYA